MSSAGKSGSAWVLRAQLRTNWLFPTTHSFDRSYAGRARKRRPKQTRGRLLFNHGLGLRVEADLVASPGGNRRHQGTQGNKGTPTHNTTDKPLHSALISLWQSAVGVACSCNAMWCGISVESLVSNSRTCFALGSCAGCSNMPVRSLTRTRRRRRATGRVMKRGIRQERRPSLARRVGIAHSPAATARRREDRAPFASLSDWFEKQHRKARGCSQQTK